MLCSALPILCVLIHRGPLCYAFWSTVLSNLVWRGGRGVFTDFRVVVCVCSGVFKCVRVGSDACVCAMFTCVCVCQVCVVRRLSAEVGVCFEVPSWSSVTS